MKTNVVVFPIPRNVDVVQDALLMYSEELVNAAQKYLESRTLRNELEMQNFIDITRQVIAWRKEYLAKCGKE